MSKLEIAKKQLQILKLKTLVAEKEFKILEREEDIKRIQIEVDEYNNSIAEVESQLQKD